jgi:hypothetical protein
MRNTTFSRRISERALVFNFDDFGRACLAGQCLTARAPEAAFDNPQAEYAIVCTSRLLAPS